MSSASITPRCKKRILKEMNTYSKENGQLECVKVKCDESNILEWYFLFHNINDDDYLNGQYIGSITLTSNYPFKAPVIRMLTPSGRFDPSKNICTSFSHYHEEQWSPQWTIQSCCVGLLSLMLENDAQHLGLGGIITKSDTKKELAKNSMEWNQKHIPDILKLFKEFIN